MAPCSCWRPGSIRSRGRSRFRSRRTGSPSSLERVTPSLEPPPASSAKSSRMARPGKNSDQALIELFLDMVAAERGGAKNTLAAYGRDLADFSAELRKAGRTIAGASTDDLR